MRETEEGNQRIRFPLIENVFIVEENYGKNFVPKYRLRRR